MRRAAVLAVLAVALGLVAPTSALATAPGPNGKIAFVKNADIYTVKPDGSGLTQLTNTSAVAEAHPAFSPDGNYIAYMRNPEGHLWVMRSDGTDPHVLAATISGSGTLAWSPDGTKIAFYRSFGSQSGIWVVNADGSGRRSLLLDDTAASPSWSPDGTKIAFQRNRQIWTMNADGTGLSQLTFGSLLNFSPNWSPDGTEIVFASRTECCTDELDLYTIPSGGGSATLVTTDPSLVYSDDPVWSPDGSKIAFIECPDPATNCVNDLYVMNSDGSGVTLLQGAPVNETMPDWQPAVGPPLQPIQEALDKIAFVSERNCPGSTCRAAEEIFTMNPNGTLQRPLTDEGSWYASGPAWSPDGSKIAFGSDRPSASLDYDNEIWVMNGDGSGLVNLTNTGYTVHEGGPAWSPDGTKIAYSREDELHASDEIKLWLMNADGSGQTQLTDGTRDGSPTWSPDGSKIAFHSSGAIYTINPDGTGMTPLTAPPAGFSDGEPDWSPDGTSIVFTRSQPWPDPPGIWKMNADGTGQQQVTPGPGGGLGGASSPSWSPDGKRIAFVRRNTTPSAPANGLEVFVMAADGTGQVNITNSPRDDTAPDWSPVQGYPRPKEARLMYVSLAVAYEACAAPNRTHGPPLASPSCNPPQRLSHLTVGTFDANREAAKAVGFVRLALVGELPIDRTNGDQADIKLQVKITDVRNQSDLSDYAGDLGVSAGRRITDRDNASYPGGPGAATVQDDSLFFTVPCTATSDKADGSICELNTTADSLVPGSVEERQRAVWQLDRITVYDGGPDADPRTAPGNRPFMRQGIFIP